MPDLLTTPQAARELGVRMHVLKYAIAAYSIEPAARIGGARVWTREQLTELRAALRRTAVGASR